MAGMKITIEPTDEHFNLPDGTAGRIWRGVTAKGTHVVAVVVALGCLPEEEARFDAEVAEEGDLEFTGSQSVYLPDRPKFH